ncbi:ParB/RepB/Spo0J family partition protein [Celeribacter arenosi]|uniref:ParB/RepB/Spo0J family partition protein n=1 Tax=Celeribacter arenosi TaxID=792649 RepID=A0ABP7JXZ2_9RHOB
MADKFTKGKARGLGRGLSALMADVTPEPTTDSGESAPRRPDMVLPIESVIPNPDQPRRRFDEEKLNELADSIREKGVIQPLIVRPSPTREGAFEIVAGERRWRASQKAQLHELPVIVRDYSDTEVLEVAIIENIQRDDLNAIEEAAGYKQLMERFGHTQEKLAEGLSKSRSHIANLMRLLNLPDEVKTLVETGALSSGHARACLAAQDPAALAREIVKNGWSVREAERRAKDRDDDQPAKTRRSSSGSSTKDADTRSLEGDLSAALGMKVQIDHKDGTESGSVTVEYGSLDDLDALCQILSRSR